MLNPHLFFTDGAYLVGDRWHQCYERTGEFSKKKCDEKTDGLSVVELLATNSIFFFGNNPDKDVRSHLPYAFDSIAHQIRKELNQSNAYKPLDAECTDMCVKMENVNNL